MAKAATITAYASALNGPLGNFGAAWDTYKEDCVVGESAACGIEGLTVQATANSLFLDAVTLGEDIDKWGPYL